MKTLETIFSLIKRWKEMKYKGKIILHFDGSGEVGKVEVGYFV